MHSMSSDKSIKDAETILPAGNQKMLTEKHNDKKLTIILFICGTIFSSASLEYMVKKNPNDVISYLRSFRGLEKNEMKIE